MDYMIYIYAALAFIIAGGSGFICWHAGHRYGRRETETKYFTIKPEDYERTYNIKLMPRGHGKTEALRRQIARHQEIMDKDE